MNTIRKRTTTLVAIACLLAAAHPALARGGRGGGRPSMGHVGGGGGRSMGHVGGARPAMPHGGGQSMARPSAAHANRPSMGHASRPAPATRPSAGNFHPSGGGRPSLNRPGGGSPVANRPSVRPPTNVRPASRPSFPGGDRPSIGGGNRPGGGDRPSIGGGNRPGGGDRPSIGGGNRPGGGDRPSIGGGNRPGGGDRPSIGGGNRPGGGGDGTRFPNRPDGDRRPGDRFPDGRPDRPVIGGGGTRPGWINNGNINIGNDVNIGNRPNWDHGWNHPGWGWGGGGWAGHWHDNCIRPHYGWYNGCWNNYWGSNWYAPLAWGAVGWGLGTLTSGWGYGTAYANPYYVESAAAPYDYSQPVVVNNYASPEAPADAPPEETPESQQALKLFDDGLAQFKSGNYRGALANFNAALEKLPDDPVVHEVRALALFALGDYKPAAAALNALLSSAPGMDWTTMSSLYGNVDDYQAQLRKLEQFCQAHPDDAAAYFVLAYQYLVIGSKDAALSALKVVVQNEPGDSTARRMLDALAPAAPSSPPAPAPSPANVADNAPDEPAAGDAPQTDLVGTWRAKAGDTTIDLTVGDDSQFTWKATQPGKPVTQLSGQLASTSDQLSLESKDQGTMSGSVTSQGPDAWRFALSGAPPTDPGLSFTRIK